MDFSADKPIYAQIYDVICERILSGELQPEMRIPSVREYGASIGVNPNTVMRTYERLTNESIIFNKRGIGYFVSADAIERIREQAKAEFMQNDLPAIIRKMKLLGIDPKTLQID